MWLRIDHLLSQERLPWVGFGVIAFALTPAFFFLNFSSTNDSCPALVVDAPPAPAPIEIDLPLKSDFVVLSLENAEKQFTFSVDPPRPSADKTAPRLMVRLTKAKQTKRIEVPARLDLEFQESGILAFSAANSPFWLEINAENEAQLIVSGKEICRWTIQPQETPVQPAEEFAAETPFRMLAEARWLGKDLFALHYGDGSTVQRLEIGPLNHCVSLSSNGWLVYRDGMWHDIANLSDAGANPIARITASHARGLELEGWEGSSHVRLLLPQSPSSGIKTKGEELFSQLRVRSEKQISCTLDKQCLILRPGDWVLKADQRWKLLRKKEEKKAFLDGEIKGDVFVLDRIEAKGIVKSISGHYFNAARVQMGSIDYSVSTSRKPSRITGGKGK